MEISPAEAYRQMRKHCLTMEGAVEERPWGDIAWKKGTKSFAFTGEHSANFTLKSTPDRQQALVLHPQIRVAAYVGRFGWVTIEVIDDETLDLAKELAEESYRLVTRKR